MICQACRRETNPYGELDPAVGVVERCGHMDCKAYMPRRVVAEQPAVAMAVAAVATDAPAKPAHRVVPSFALPENAAPARPEPTADILLELARVRLGVIEAELANKRALEAEAELLRRILDAATTPTSTALN